MSAWRIRQVDADGRPIGAMTYATAASVVTRLKRLSGEAREAYWQQCVAEGLIVTRAAGAACDDLTPAERSAALEQGLIEPVADGQE